MNQRLGKSAIADIRTAMTDLCGKTAKTEAVRLAERYSVSWQYIYELTADIRPRRKPRADKGKRTFKLEPGTDTFIAAQYVVTQNLDPDQAIDLCHVRGYDNVPSPDYLRNLLRENGLGKRQRLNGRRGHRRFEADAPGKIFQCDVTALKVRWHDTKTRRVMRIDGIDKNHPQTDNTKIRVWQILLVDDFSRRRFLRYVTSAAVTSRDIVEFICEVYTEFGIPEVLYTDNGSEFKGAHVRAEKILNSVLEDRGGYRHQRHEAGNPQATGKVESGHKWAEKMDRYIGIAIEEGRTVTLEDLNKFADRISEQYNNREHSTTKQTPMERWHSKRVVLRKLPADVIESALLADDFEVKLNADMTVTVAKQSYKIPGGRPFVDYIGQKVTVVVPHTIDLIFLTLPNGEEWQIEKILSTADVAGEFRAVAETRGQKLTKELKAARKEEIKKLKAETKLTGEIAPVPHLDVEMEKPETNVANFPQAEHIVPAAELDRIVPVANGTRTPSSADKPAAPDFVYRGEEMDYWMAVASYKSQFENIEDCKQFLLTLFPGTEGIQPACDIEAAIDNRRFNTRQLRAVS